MSTETDELAAGLPTPSLKETNALSPTSLLFAVLASVVCTVLTPAFGAGRIGTLAGAAAGPVVAAIITTHGRGPARIVGIGGLTLAALVITVTGFTVTELAGGGQSLTTDRQGTFIDTRSSEHAESVDTPSATEMNGGGNGGSGPDIQLPSAIGCEEIVIGPSADGSEATAEPLPALCEPIDIRSVGSQQLQITSLELDSEEAFQVDDSCVGTWPPGKSCKVVVEFTGSIPGDYQAVLVVNQNLPGPASYVTLNGSVSCVSEAESTPGECGSSSLDSPTAPSGSPAPDPDSETSGGKEDEGDTAPIPNADGSSAP